MSIEEPVSVWQGSRYTASDIAHQIMQRWGEEAVKEYHPEINCFTFRGWQDRGYRVKKGEKALRTTTFMRTEDKARTEKEGKTVYVSYPKTVCLFFIRQVEPNAGVKKIQEEVE